MNKEYCLECNEIMGNSLNRDSGGEPVHKKCMPNLEVEDAKKKI